MAATRVLIVDDAPLMRDALREIFCEAGLEVVGEAADGRQAIERHRSLGPTLIVMDVAMPFLGGIEATRTIVGADPAACVIMCSALDQEALVTEAIAAGAADFVVKPCGAATLMGVVRRALAARD